MASIGVLGGSFNPIHNGHLELAHTALVSLPCDKVIFLPAYMSPFKIGQPCASAEDRCNMISLAIEQEPRFELNRMEVDREEPSYTANTLPQLALQYPNDQLIWIMGSDAFLSFDRWYHPEIIAGCAQLATVCRDDTAMENLQETAKRFETQYHTHCTVMHMQQIPVSSTMIRLNADEHAQAIPEKVYEYMKEHKLYAEI